VAPTVPPPAWRELRGADLVAAQLTARWYAWPDDTIGGWSVMPDNSPPSTGIPAVGSFLSEQAARHIADLHNASLTSAGVQPLDQWMRQHLDQATRTAQAGQTSIQVGDLIPEHRTIPSDVLEVRTCEGEVWRRAVGEERYSPSDNDLPPDVRQPYDWVHHAYGDISGHCTDRGLLDYAPLTVTKVAAHA